MIASLLPLPQRQVRDMEERGQNNAHGSSEALDDYSRQFGPMDDARYESARWWRTLNRYMSVPGILIVAAAVCTTPLIENPITNSSRLS